MIWFEISFDSTKKKFLYKLQFIKDHHIYIPEWLASFAIRSGSTMFHFFCYCRSGSLNPHSGLQIPQRTSMALTKYTMGSWRINEHILSKPLHFVFYNWWWWWWLTLGHTIQQLYLAEAVIT